MSPLVQALFVAFILIVPALVAYGAFYVFYQWMLRDKQPRLKQFFRCFFLIGGLLGLALSLIGFAMQWGSVATPVEWAGYIGVLLYFAAIVAANVRYGRPGTAQSSTQS